jgi:hypothetical protein
MTPRMGDEEAGLATQVGRMASIGPVWQEFVLVGLPSLALS